MSMLIIFNYSRSDEKKIEPLRAVLHSRDFIIRESLTELPALGFFSSWEDTAKTINNCNAVIAFLSPFTLTSPKRAINHALEQYIPVVPVILEGDPASVIPPELKGLEWIDLSASDRYPAELEQLIDRLHAIDRSGPKSGYQLVEEEIQQLVTTFTGMRWLRFVHTDGLSYDLHQYNAGKIKRDTPVDREEDRYSTMTVVTLGLSERISEELVLGHPRFTVIAGKERTQFLFPVGDGAKYVLSFVIDGHPPVGQILEYFETRQYLAELEPRL